jgi:hypothetical protein
MGTMSTTIDEATTAASDAVNATAEAVNRTTDRVREEFGSTEKRVRELVDAYPLTCFLGAVVTGYLLGRIATRV